MPHSQYTIKMMARVLASSLIKVPYPYEIVVGTEQIARGMVDSMLQCDIG